jgi:hypothetical protein
VRWRVGDDGGSVMIGGEGGSVDWFLAMIAVSDGAEIGAFRWSIDGAGYDHDDGDDDDDGDDGMFLMRLLLD